MLRLLLVLILPLISILNAQTFPVSPDQNLPGQRIGTDDLLSVSVYDRPELTRTVRVRTDGKIELPLLSAPIVAAGLMPDELQKVIETRLADEEILVRPVVSVAVVEYRSRPVSVMGSVRRPLTFQVSGKVQLLDALARAEGLTPEAGSEILVTKPATDDAPSIITRISVKLLIDDADAAANLTLTGGEQIRIPEAGKVFVVGNVKKPGAFLMHDNESLTVLKILALSEGLLPFATKDAYVYRRGEGGEHKEEVIELQKIVRRKSPDVMLSQNDILYIPDNRGQRLTVTTLERIAAFGSAAGSAAVYGMTR
jgi:polysaccharide export outer membrane protein